MSSSKSALHVYFPADIAAQGLSRLIMVYYIGCSGYYYKEWKGVFYPETLGPKDWFRFYCTRFNTIEINATFYRMPSVAYPNAGYNGCRARTHAC